MAVVRQIQNSAVSSLRGVAKALSVGGMKTARGGEGTAVRVSDILRREQATVRTQIDFCRRAAWR